MYVHHTLRLIYLANPRTASRSTAKALQGIGFRMVGTHHSGLHDEYDYRTGRWLKITTVRDVSDLLSSWARHSQTTVEDFVNRCLPGIRAIIPEWEPWTLFPHARHADVLLDFKEVESQLNAVLAGHGLGPVTLERIGNP